MSPSADTFTAKTVGNPKNRPAFHCQMITSPNVASAPTLLRGTAGPRRRQEPFKERQRWRSSIQMPVPDGCGPLPPVLPPGSLPSLEKWVPAPGTGGVHNPSDFFLNPPTSPADNNAPRLQEPVMRLVGVRGRTGSFAGNLLS